MNLTSNLFVHKTIKQIIYSIKIDRKYWKIRKKYSNIRLDNELNKINISIDTGSSKNLDNFTIDDADCKKVFNKKSLDTLKKFCVNLYEKEEKIKRTAGLNVVILNSKDNPENFI